MRSTKDGVNALNERQKEMAHDVTHGASWSSPPLPSPNPPMHQRQPQMHLQKTHLTAHHPDHVQSFPPESVVPHLSFTVASTIASALAARSLNRPASAAETCPFALSLNDCASSLDEVSAACKEACPDSQASPAGLRKLSRS